MIIEIHARRYLAASAVCAVCLVGAALPGGPSGAAFAQEAADVSARTPTIDGQPESIGRSWPVVMGPVRLIGPGGAANTESGEKFSGEEPGVIPIGAPAGEVPEGIDPLEVDIFTTTDFYQDSEYWTDPRYYRCASSHALEAIRGGYLGNYDMIGDRALEDAPWGRCDVDYPREGIVSPYPFTTAQEHFEALKMEAAERGGPTQYTAQTLPDWSGKYRMNHLREEFTEYPFWTTGRISQMSTLVSLLTPEYQKRLVQERYHEAINNAAQWPGSYCWPEGLTRWWFALGEPVLPQANPQITMHPDQITILAGFAANFLRQVVLDVDFPVMDSGVPHFSEIPAWYGETIGFWDNDALISWTSNVQPWTNHMLWENSDKLQIIEIWTPRFDEAGEFLGLTNEAIFYDEDALVEPVRAVTTFDRISALNEGNPYGWIECFQTIYPIEGYATPVAPDTTVEIYVPDYLARPWARIWEKYFEEGMNPPADDNDALFGFGGGDQ